MAEQIKDAKPDKEKKTRDEILEIVVVILLGITALLTAWGSWIGSLHGGNQATNYTRSNNLAAEGNAEYNAAIQSLTQDMMLYNEVNNLLIDQVYAEESGDTAQVEALDWKINEYIMGNFSEELADAMLWASEESETSEETVSPFEMEGFIESYFDSANELLTESEAVLEEGSADNTNADSYGLVTVIYSVVLFLLGIVGTFKNQKNRFALICISGAAFLIATVYMLTIPMPTGFSFNNFFGG